MDEFLCSSHIYMLKIYPQCDGIRRLGLQEVIRLDEIRRMGSPGWD